MMICEAFIGFFASSLFMGYVIMGIMSFFLGICATLLVYKLHYRHKPQDQEEQQREL